jgi:adenylate cyclase
MDSEYNTSITGPATSSSSPSSDQVHDQLQRILADPQFRATKAQRAFLRYVVEKVLSGETDDIKGYNVATQVFGRKEDFDQASDPIVSIHANKLRRALEHYYLVNGTRDAVRIDIPKGTYVPTFYHQSVSAEKEEIQVVFNEQNYENDWPVVLVVPLENLSSDSDLGLLAVGLQTELVQEITRFKDIRVLMFPGVASGRRITDCAARFLLSGSIRKDRIGIKVTVSLTDARTSMRLWSDVYHTDFEAAQLFSFQEHVSRTIVSRIVGEYGIIPKTISLESKKLPPAQLSTYQAILQYYEFDRNFTADTFNNAFQALRLATEKEPDCGIAWSMLARLHAVNCSLELFDLGTTLEEALEFAQKGVRLEPASQRTRLILGFVQLLRGNIEAGRQEIQKAADLNPKAVLFMENIGYLMTLCGDWENGPAIIRKAISLNPFYNLVVHHTLWLDHAQQKDYQQALIETHNFRTPSLFWDPLLRASALGLTNNIVEGKGAATQLLALKPDFASSGRRLIEYYVKFDELVETILEGLHRVGVTVD